MGAENAGRKLACSRPLGAWLLGCPDRGGQGRGFSPPVRAMNPFSGVHGFWPRGFMHFFGGCMDFFRGVMAFAWMCFGGVRIVRGGGQVGPSLGLQNNQDLYFWRSNLRPRSTSPQCPRVWYLIRKTPLWYFVGGHDRPQEETPTWALLPRSWTVFGGSSWGLSWRHFCVKETDESTEKIHGKIHDPPKKNPWKIHAIHFPIPRPIPGPQNS